MNSGSSSSNNRVDGFSRLGSDLLVAMLCLLPFKECVRNSVLSKQWQFLWFGCKNIELDETNFVKVEDNPVARWARRQDFIAFLRRWMDNFNNDSIETLMLRVSNPREYTEDVNRCISLALSKGVKSLSLDFSDLFIEQRHRKRDTLFDLPPQIYHQTGLYSLKLFSCRFDLSKFEDQILRGLKELSLGHMCLTGPTVFTINAGVCSSLEILSLTRCRSTNRLDLQGQNVETLVIDRCQDVYIDAPDIRVFKYCGEVGAYEPNFGDALQEVEFEFDDEFHEPCGYLLYDMMIQFDYVRTMTLCSYMLQVIPTGEECIGMGNPLDVRHLTLNTSAQEADLWGISFFLNSCPFLETLILQIAPPKILEGYQPPLRGSLHCFYPPSSYLYQCILRTLKVVQVKGFKATRGEMYVLKHLIKYGRVLQEISVYFSPEVGGQYPRSVAALMAVPRASPRLHIMTYY